MANLLFVIPHSTDEPDRAATALSAALAAQATGHAVALWLHAEGSRLGVAGVAETLREPGPRTASETIEQLARQGATLHVSGPCFRKREFEPDVLRAGARLVEPAELGDLLAAGWRAVTL
jgi:predicted peroxiredoxin